MISKPWWESDRFDDDAPVADQLRACSGPKGLALVQVWGDGRTQPGWGLNPPPGSTDGFMPRYLRDEFNPRRAEYAYNRKGTPFAFVMRGVQAVCVDVDGKNGGIEQLKKFGLLPPTLAETSKSGNGLHLFYYTDEVWDPALGYARYSDHIAIEQGIDFRGVGCVYHYHTQRWNNRHMAPLPEFIAEVLRSKENYRANQAGRFAAVVASNDETEILLMQDQLITELKKPIPDGKRNNTLFAIGSQMRDAEVPNWDQLVYDRAVELGLSDDEAGKIVENIGRYAPSTAATP